MYVNNLKVAGIKLDSIATCIGRVSDKLIAVGFENSKISIFNITTL
jgi:hypothetical protein